MLFVYLKESNTMRILITGGAGYIGSHVAHDLTELGHKLIIFDNFSTGRKENIPDGAEIIEGDIRNKSDVKKAFSKEINFVFHFAALKAAGESMVTPEIFAETNIHGTLNLLSAMSDTLTKYFVFSSSAAVYGNPVYLPIDEKHPTNPTNYYGYTKLSIEENLKWFAKLKGIIFASLRYFNATGYDVKGRVKGREKNPQNLFPIIMETLTGQREKMQVFGTDYNTPDGSCIRDYIHVNDLADAHLKAMDYLLATDENLIVNLGTGKGYSVLEAINAAERTARKKLKYEITGRRAGDPETLYADASLAFQLLGWKAKYSELETIFKSMLKVYSIV